MKAGFAAAGERAALARLWMDCFGDSEDYVNKYFAAGFVPEDVFVLRDGAVPAAMAISFPVDCCTDDGDSRTGAYLYAVCTAPDRRGQGCCRAVMDFAEQALAARGCDFVCLKPASDALAATYGRRGYQECFFSSERTVAAGGPPVCLRPIDAVRYGLLRQLQLRGGFVEYPPQTLAHQARLGPLYEVTAGELFGICAVERYGAGRDEAASTAGTGNPSPTGACGNGGRPMNAPAGYDAGTGNPSPTGACGNGGRPMTAPAGCDAGTGNPAPTGACGDGGRPMTAPAGYDAGTGNPSPMGACGDGGLAVIVKEFLGDEALLPGLCTALGAARLTVRIPPQADAVPFAMAKPLGGAPCPGGYLAFAFD